MSDLREQSLAISQAQVQALTDVTSRAFSGVEELVWLQMAAAKAVVHRLCRQAEKALDAKDPVEWCTLQMAMFEPLPEECAAYGQQLFFLLLLGRYRGSGV